MIANILIGFVILIHLYIVWLEMFAWTTRGRKVFRSLPPEIFEPTKVLAANQGLYNGFLAAGLIWTYCINDAYCQQYVRYFFLGCIMIAGLYGAWSADRKILYVQFVPAALAMVVVWLRI